MQLVAALVATFGAVALADSHLYMRSPLNTTMVPPPTNVTMTQTSTPGVTVTSTPGVTATTTAPVGGGTTGGNAGNYLQAHGSYTLGGAAIAAVLAWL